MPLREPVPDLRSLDLLRSVAELGSIRQAAQRHVISQPAASMRLRALEAALGVALLDRSRGRAQLTAVGRAVVQWSEPALDAVAELLLGTTALRASASSHATVVASMTVAEYLVPGWLHRLQSVEPHVSVSLLMGNSHHVVDVLRAGDADLGFVEGPSAPEGLASRVVREDDLVVVVAPAHPWSRRRRALRAAELASTPLVVREVGSGTRDVLEAALHRHELDLTTTVALGSTTAIKAAVATGDGVGVLSRMAVANELLEGRLVEVAVADLPLTRSIRMVWPRGVAHRAATKALIKIIDDAEPRVR